MAPLRLQRTWQRLGGGAEHMVAGNTCSQAALGPVHMHPAPAVPSLSIRSHPNTRLKPSVSASSLAALLLLLVDAAAWLVPALTAVEGRGGGKLVGHAFATSLSVLTQALSGPQVIVCCAAGGRGGVSGMDGAGTDGGSQGWADGPR